MPTCLQEEAQTPKTPIQQQHEQERQRAESALRFQLSTHARLRVLTEKDRAELLSSGLNIFDSEEVGSGLEDYENERQVARRISMACVHLRNQVQHYPRRDRGGGIDETNLSAYEHQRNANVQENLDMLKTLGLL